MNKKILIAIGLLTVITIVVLILLPQRKVAPSTNPIANSSNKNSNYTSIPIPTRIPGWNKGDNQYYTVEFPITWKPELSKVAEGGISLVVTPITASTIDQFPRFYLEASPKSSKNTIQSTINSLKPLSFAQQSMTYNGLPAIMLSGIIPLNRAVINHSGIKKTFIIFEKSNTMYVLDYAYYLDVNPVESEDILRKITNSVYIK